MLTLARGQVVRSPAGRDCSSLLAVISVEGSFALLADGKHRPLERLKRKSIKHLSPTDFSLSETQLASNRGLRKALGALRSVNR